VDVCDAIWPRFRSGLESDVKNLHLGDRAEVHPIFAGGGEIGALLRAMDWTTTPLGPPESWPQSLRTAVSILLNSRYPMFLFWGPSLVKIYNDGYRPITGAKHPWALGRPGREVWPEIWDTIGPMVDRVVSHGEATWSADLRLFMERNGFPEEVYFTFSYSPVRDESGGVGGMFCACTETTEKVLGERRLKTLRDLAAGPAEAATAEAACARSAAVLADNPADVPFSLIYLHDDHGRSGGVGEARLVAASGVEVGRSISPHIVRAGEPGGWPVGPSAELPRPQRVEDLAAQFREVPAGPWPEPPHQAMVLPLVAQGHEGAVGYLIVGLSSRRPFDDDYKGFCSLVANQIATSVARARALEAERRRLEALAEIDRAKTAFFSNVSHEFRTPLTLMLGPTEDLLAGAYGELTSAQRAQLEILRRNELRLQRLVNALLDFSRIESGRVRASYEAVELARLTRDLASSFRAAIERAGLRFVVDCVTLAEPVFVDREMWEQIVLNLLSNAFKFTFEGTIEVSLRDGGEHVVLRVSDTGVGVRDEELPRLFERFHRVEGTRARTHEGSGIGLALVQELVRLHGGTIEVESEYGRGTTLTIAIPKGSAHLPRERIGAARDVLAPTSAAFVEEALRWIPDAPAAGEPARAASSARAAGPRRRVLVADDNADMRDYLRNILAVRWEVETVANGRAALEAARRDRPDVILTDVMMPVLDGLGLVRELHADPQLETIPVIMVSARVGEESRVEGLDAGADDYLVKPFAARELVARVATQLKLAAALASVDRQWREALAVMRQVPVPIALVTMPEGRYELVNEAHVAALGRDVTGLVVEDAHPDAEVAAERRAELERWFVAEDAVVATELPRIDDHGAIRYVDLTSRVWRDPDGARRGVIEISVDVTDQVLARRQSEESHQRVARVTAMRDEFLAVASHELRTPLTTLGLQAQGLVEAIRSAPAADPPVARWLGRAERLAAQAGRLEQLIEAMLDVFGLGREELALALEPVDLAEVARSLVDRLARESRRAREAITVRTEPTHGRWDRARVEQILTQLIGNALKFGGEQPIDVVVAPAGETARIVVVDRGIGIASEDHQRIFGRLERAAPSDQYGGLGLGLWIVDELVRRMGGEVRVDSKPGRGATFVVELPRTS
jgi:signal transduction histidine kinase